jgi:uncharacterized protein (DUF305 family)
MKINLLTALLLTAGCSSVSSQSTPANVSTPAPAGASVVGSGEASAIDPSYTEADVAFMQGMIGHHSQAVEMTALVAERAARPEIRLLARRIDISQVEEMEIMRRWLRERGEEVPVAVAPGGHAHHQHSGHGTGGAEHALMPGMLTEAELGRLRAARGEEFDRLFLEFMIRHHEGALVMVADLFAAGGGQDPEIFQFASHVDGDQRIEIARMYRLLAAGG